MAQRSKADLEAIAAELATDPLGLGYLPNAPPNDIPNGEAMSLVREAIQIDRSTIDPSALFSRIDKSADYDALPDGDKQWIGQMLQTGGQAGGVVIDKDSEIRRALIQIFPAGSNTRNNLLPLLSEAASRAEEMFRQGTLEVGGTVTAPNVADSRSPGSRTQRPR